MPKAAGACSASGNHGVPVFILLSASFAGLPAGASFPGIKPETNVNLG